MRFVLIVAVIFFSLPSARAGELVWQAPAGCPDTASFAARIESVPLGDLDVWTEVTGDAGTWHVRIEIRAGEQVLLRELDAASCEEAAGAAALVITLLAEDLAPPPAPPVPAAPRPRLADQRTRDVEAAPRRAGIDLRAAARGGIGWGTQPDAAPLVGAALVVGLADFRLEVGLDYWPTQRQSVATGAGVELTLWATTWRACWAPGWLNTCAGVELGELRARGFGAPFVDTGREPWTAAVVLLGGRWKAAPWLVFSLGAEVVRPFERAVFVVESERLVVVEPWSERLVVGVEGTIL